MFESLHSFSVLSICKCKCPPCCQRGWWLSSYFSFSHSGIWCRGNISSSRQRVTMVRLQSPRAKVKSWSEVNLLEESWSFIPYSLKQFSGADVKMKNRGLKCILGKMRGCVKEREEVNNEHMFQVALSNLQNKHLKLGSLFMPSERETSEFW